MSYVPFSAGYSMTIRTPAYVAAETARKTAQRSTVHQAMVDGNRVMGNLVTDCCSDPAFGGQGYFDAGSGNGGSGGAAGGNGGVNPDVAAITAAVKNYKLTPVDIITGTNGFPVRADGKPWPRPRKPAKDRWAQINGYPNYTTGDKQIRALVPPCPCFSSAPPIPMAVPQVVAPAAAVAPASSPAPANCPYPECSTGNVCLDLVTGCALNSQVDPAQQKACALANYGVFGNQGQWFGRTWRSCQPPQYLGTPLPNPPQADPSMRSLIDASVGPIMGKGLTGLGQTDGTSNVGGFLAIVGLFGIVVWATRK